MARRQKLIVRVLSGTADASINFADLCTLLKFLGFDERIKGDHHIFTRDGVEEILNLQPKKGKAKPYQVKQIRQIIVNYRLAEEADET